MYVSICNKQVVLVGIMCIICQYVSFEYSQHVSTFWQYFAEAENNMDHLLYSIIGSFSKIKLGASISIIHNLNNTAKLKPTLCILVN
jgi:hypothetical protein